MTQAEKYRRATVHVRGLLRGWAFSTLELRRGKVKAAREALNDVPDWARASALREIEAVESHCLFD